MYSLRLWDNVKRMCTDWYYAGCTSRRASEAPETETASLRTAPYRAVETQTLGTRTPTACYRYCVRACVCAYV